MYSGAGEPSLERAGRVVALSLISLAYLYNTGRGLKMIWSLIYLLSTLLNLGGGSFFYMMLTVEELKRSFVSATEMVQKHSPGPAIMLLK